MNWVIFFGVVLAVVCLGLLLGGCMACWQFRRDIWRLHDREDDRWPR